MQARGWRDNVVGEPYLMLLSWRLPLPAPYFIQKSLLRLRLHRNQRDHYLPRVVHLHREVKPALFMRAELEVELTGAIAEQVDAVKHLFDAFLLVTG